ncbi:hypothetical protein CIW49_18595 [Mycolicibacterium sp. P1-18]|uniref:hypothetical protein n=1 Tax=Mycolicibacterium sp. P1-18 TaxID=2024615 RepID=UPI0011F18E84|nr:hypothetical protein [Mycolicibacterium sp. P1-18]KAA0096682.1 hypothetical protein CIW49_18595 [Mycolicibacterium sp. P1-18]
MTDTTPPQTVLQRDRAAQSAKAAQLLQLRAEADARAAAGMAELLAAIAPPTVDAAAAPAATPTPNPTTFDTDTSIANRSAQLRNMLTTIPEGT